MERWAATSVNRWSGMEGTGSVSGKRSGRRRGERRERGGGRRRGAGRGGWVASLAQRQESGGRGEPTRCGGGQVPAPAAPALAVAGGTCDHRSPWPFFTPPIVYYPIQGWGGGFFLDAPLRPRPSSPAEPTGPHSLPILVSSLSIRPANGRWRCGSGPALTL